MKIDMEYLVTEPVLLGELKSGDHFIFMKNVPVQDGFFRENSMNAPIGQKAVRLSDDEIQYNGLIPVLIDGEVKIRHFHCQSSVKIMTK